MDFTSVTILVVSFKIYSTASFSARESQPLVKGMKLTGSTALALHQAAPD